MEDGHQEVNLERALTVLRRRAPWVLLCLVLAAGAAFGFSTQQTRKYTATASLVFGNNQLSQQVAGVQPATNNNPQTEQATNAELLHLGDMAAQIARRLGQGLTKKTVDASLSISTVGATNVVNVSATSPSASLAAAIANTYSMQFVQEQQSSNQKNLSSALALVNKALAALSPQQRAGPAGVALAVRAQSLAILAQTPSGNVQVAQIASVPKSPSSPKVFRNTMLGAGLGLLVGLGLAFLLERLDRRIREPKDLEDIHRLPLLGVIPESDALSRSARANPGPREALPPSEAEAFRFIRAKLRYFNVDRDLRTLLVVSAARGDGKTTVARHLAAVVATMGARTLLMEADLRGPSIAQQLAINSGPGLSDVLIGSIRMADAIQSIDVGPIPSEGGADHKLDVLVAGPITPPNPGELIESLVMKDVLGTAKSVYGLVVIDTPALARVSDALPLLNQVDGIIIVGRIGRSRRDVAQRLHETLGGVQAPLLGVVANGFSSALLGSG